VTLVTMYTRPRAFGNHCWKQLAAKHSRVQQAGGRTGCGNVST
jgi:hypothetical protein